MSLQQVMGTNSFHVNYSVVISFVPKKPIWPLQLCAPQIQTGMNLRGHSLRPTLKIQGPNVAGTNLRDLS